MYEMTGKAAAWLGLLGSGLHATCMRLDKLVPVWASSAIIIITTHRLMGACILK